MPRTMLNFDKKSVKITVFLDDFSPKLTIVSPKCVSWLSNQEWCSICVDTISDLVLSYSEAEVLRAAQII